MRRQEDAVMESNTNTIATAVVAAIGAVVLLAVGVAALRVIDSLV